MENSIVRISLDVQAANAAEIVTAKQGDTARRVIVSLTDGGFPYRIADGCTVALNAVKPDGTKIFNSCAVEDNRVIYQMTAQTTSVAGRVLCELRIYGPDDMLLTSARFCILVEKALSGDIPASEDEVDALTHLISEASEAISHANGTAEELRQMAEDGEFDGEPGEPGETPNIQIGTVESVPYTSPAEVSRSGTDENPVFSFKIPGGRPGEKGEPGRTPEKGVDYFDGEPGAPGYSPSANVQREADGVRITITDEDGTTTAKVYDGQGGGGDVPAWVTPDKPKVSYFENDAGYLTQHQSLANYATKTELAGKQNTITDLATIRSGAAAGATALQPGQIASWAKQPTKPSYTAQEVGALPNSTVIPPDLTTDVNELKDKVKDIELFKFPNATITGSPSVESGQVSGFSNADYMAFPFILDVRSFPFSVDFCFTTGADVTTQQNILDSAFGLALAIRNGRGLMALGSDGQSFNIGQVAGSYPIAANHTYYARLSWDRTVYRTALSVDGVNYTNDMAITSAAGLFPTTIYIGGSPDLFGAGTAHPFKGSINFNRCFVSVNGQVIWQGMDDAGLSTRASVSLDNLDEKGEARFATDPTLSVPGMPADAAETYKLMKPRGGVAVVFGDSQFESSGIYSFADFLRGKGLYREVVNYAIGGCHFKYTVPQYSFVDILQRTDVLADVERADEIWLHLGGNDAQTRAATGGSVDEFSAAVFQCMSILKSHNPDVLIWFVNSLPTAPEIAEIYTLNKGAFTENYAVSMCQSTFALDSAIAFSDINIISARKSVDNIVFATQGNDGLHPTKEAAAAWFEAIWASDFKGTRKLDYFYSDGTDLAEIHDTLVKTGKLLPNCTACFHQQNIGFLTVPLHAVLGNAIGQIAVFEYGYSIQCTVTSAAIEVSMLPLNPAEKEWALKGTITTGSSVSVDLTGCTELIIFGTVTATGNTSLLSNGGTLVYNAAQNGGVSLFAHWKDWFKGMECIAAAMSSGTVRQYGGSSNGYSNSADKKVSSVKRLYFSNPDVVAECNIEIYAR